MLSCLRRVKYINKKTSLEKPWCYSVRICLRHREMHRIPRLRCAWTGHGQRTYWFKVILPATSAPLEKQHALGAENARDFCLVRFSLRFYVTRFCLHVGSFGFPFRLLFWVIGLHFAPLWAPLGSIWAPRGSLWVAFSRFCFLPWGKVRQGPKRPTIEP